MRQCGHITLNVKYPKCGKTVSNLHLSAHNQRFLKSQTMQFKSADNVSGEMIVSQSAEELGLKMKLLTLFRL